MEDHVNYPAAVFMVEEVAEEEVMEEDVNVLEDADAALVDKVRLYPALFAIRCSWCAFVRK